MKYRLLGKCNVQVSEIGFGAWAIGGPSESAGVQWGWSGVQDEEAIAAVKRARELGVNFFDTADVYGNGHSEELLGRALAGQQDVFIASKVGNVVRGGVAGKDWSAAHIVDSCEKSLRRLRRQTIDLYQLHNPEIRDIRHGDWPKTMEKLQKEGKIRWWGVSVFTPEEAMAVLERGNAYTIQIAYNALRQEMVEKILPRTQKDNVGVIARVPLYYGLLTGKYNPDTRFPSNDHRSHTLPPDVMRQLTLRAQRLASIAGDQGPGTMAQWALRYVLSHPAVSTTIPGARNPQQAEQNCAASNGVQIPPEQLRAVRQFWEADPYLRDLRTGL